MFCSKLGLGLGLENHNPNPDPIGQWRAIRVRKIS